MLDRTKEPAIHEISEIRFTSPEERRLNGVPFYHMAAVPNETCRFDLYFNAGKIAANHSLASITNGLLLSGTSELDSNQIQDKINSLGAYYESGVSMENAVISIYCLKENLIKAIEVITDAILRVEFPKHEVEEYINDRIQQLQISLKKVSFNAQRAFQRQLFASDERYAQISEADDFRNCTQQEIVDFHHQAYINGLEKVVLVGDLDETAIKDIEALLQNFGISTALPSTELKNQPGSYYHELPEAVQSAIRIGKILFTKEHPDYLDFLILNTILGDYFGSRLMSNLRENKGYTYGIGSHIVEFEKSGYLLIGTEVKKEVREDAIAEIKLEVENLQNNLVDDMELNIVKSYMMGQLLKSADGPYAMTDLFLSAIVNGKDLSFYNEAIASIQGITPTRIQELAQKHLKWEDFTIVSAG